MGQKCRSAAPPVGAKIVLYWTNIWFRDPIRDILFHAHDLYRCNDRCYITSNRCYASSADSVVFHFSNVSVFDLPDKKSDQIWIYYIQESPENSKHHALKLRLIDSKIDSVMSYRSDSGIHVPYGRFIRKDRHWTPVSLKGPKVAWFASNCHTASRREDLVSQLAKYIPVHVFGSCGSYSCPYGNESCNQMLENNYSFYLAFENSLCRDYVTEKTFRTMSYNVIPVVMSSFDNYSILPNGSYIDANKFSSVRYLARYLYRVARNHTLYNSFLAWKAKFEAVSLDWREELCAPCYLKRQPRPESWHNWWFQDTCTTSDSKK